MATNLQEIATVGAAPIPGENPAGMGSAVRYESEYERMTAEIEKLQSVSGEQPRWPEVIKLAQTILSKKSKELTAASFMTAALLQTDGYRGLAAGLGALKDMLATYWDKLIPPPEKQRAREAALQWMAERTAKNMQGRPTPFESDREPLTACKTELEQINALLQEKGCSTIGELPRAVDDKIGSIPVPTTTTDGSGESTSTGTAAAPPAEIDTPERAREAVFKAAAFLRQASAADPLPYKLVRAAVWNDLLLAPEHRNGQTTLAGGDASLPEAWEEALRKKEFARVIDEAETRFANDRLWLDLHLYEVRAMEGLGAAYEGARRAVADEVAALVRRIPELPDLKFEGGLPFAGEAARVWIRNELVPAASAAGAGESKLEAVLREARKLATRKKLTEAMGLLQKEMQGVPPGRERFLWRLALARVLVESGRANLAVPQLESLDKEVERYALEEWEPALTVEVVKLLWQCYSSVSSGEGAADKASRTYERLCRLDLTAAMALKQ